MKGFLKIFTLLMLVVLTMGVVACDNGDSESEPHRISVSIQVFLADYSALQVDSIVIEEQTVVLTEGSGVLDIESQKYYDKGANLAVSAQGYDVVWFNKTVASGEERLLVFILPSGQRDLSKDLLEIGGCAVFHYDGETRLGGGKLYVNDTLMHTIDESGNFHVYVLVGDELEIRQEGYRFVDVGGDEKSSYLVTETTSVIRFRAVALA